MTTTKRMGLASAAIALLGAAAAYAIAMLVVRTQAVPSAAMCYAMLGLIAALTAVVLVVFWRSTFRAAGAIGGQLRDMVETGQIGMVMTGGADRLDKIAHPLNEVLTDVKEQIEDLRAQNRELEIQSRVAAAEKNHTEAIIFSISDAVLVTSKFDELILANQAAERLLGFELSTALRENIERVISDGTLVRLVRETRAHGQSFTRKVVEHTIDQRGEPRTFSITLSCVVGPANEVSGVVAVLHDITREKEIAKMKTDFVSNVSHELKTPLSSIKAYVEMLVDGEAEDETTRREFYEIISSETDRLHRLIENILNISRIESGVVKVVREPASLTAIAKQVLDVAVPQARLKHIELVDRLAPMYHQIEADRDMIYQAVLNLVSNALKYTPDGGKVTVSVFVEERRGVALCQVADTGMGIPTEDLPHIFDKFFRVRASKRMAKGTGLGLTLVKHIVETVHDGKLSVTSESGKGSTFSFELPILT